MKEKEREQWKKIMGTINIREARIGVLDPRVLSWPNYLTRSYNMERQNVEPIKEKIIGITSFRI